MKAMYPWVVLVICCAQIQAPAPQARKQAAIPRFQDYPVGPIFQGKPVKLDWPPDWRDDEYFRGAIQDLIDGGVNFAGHYTVRDWSCGTDCHWLVVLDMKTGTFPQGLPYGSLSVTYEEPSPYEDHDWLQFRPESRLLVASGCFDVKSLKGHVECGTKYFELRGTQFSLVKYVPRPTPEFLRNQPPGGMTLEVSPEHAVQGSLLRVEVGSETPLTTVQGEWAEHTVSFWRSNARGTLYRAYLGIDLEQSIGDHFLRVTVSPSEGEPKVMGAVVRVQAGRFALEKLTVAPQFVEPSAAELERAQKETERLHAIFSGQSSERLWSGSFRFPLDGPRRGDNFGRRRILNGEPRSPHGGLDIPAKTGTPVHAAQRGRVALAAEMYFSGNTVVVDHGLGMYTFYGHLSEIAVKEGDLVERGTLLGRVGATGRVTGPHLHWGLIVNEAKVNPLQILPPETKKK